VETRGVASGNRLSLLDWWRRHRFLAMVGLAVIISMFLVIVAMGLYSSSGAAQLDLSRPGYQAVRKEVTQDPGGETYPDTGVLDKAAIEQFMKLYDNRAASVSVTNSFDPTAMTDETLQLFQAAQDK